MMKACQKYMPMYQTKMLQNESIDIRSDTRYERTTSESEKKKKKPHKWSDRLTKETEIIFLRKHFSNEETTRRGRKANKNTM